MGRGGVDVGAEVLRLAGLAREAGAAGVACGGGEVSRVRAAHGPALSILVPGVRLEGSSADDQGAFEGPWQMRARSWSRVSGWRGPQPTTKQRVTTVRAAAVAGSRLVIVVEHVGLRSVPSRALRPVNHRPLAAMKRVANREHNA